MKDMNINFINSDRIAHALMLKSFFLNDAGLFEGQMGIVLALSEYSRKKEEDAFFDFSFDLLENILLKVNKGLTFSLSNGLAGIGWGIEYLIQNTGFEGLLHYIIYHLQGALNTNTEFGLPFDDRYLSDLYKICKMLNERIQDLSISLLLDVYIGSAY